MIARGDLAVECGFENLAQSQERILALCQAADVPVIWATQVLENMAKKGMPSRAEITDAAMASRAQCVMLNKGPYILRAMKTLDGLLRQAEAKKAGTGLVPDFRYESPASGDKGPFLVKSAHSGLTMRGHAGGVQVTLKPLMASAR
jgi:pyruvate kinase